MLSFPVILINSLSIVMIGGIIFVSWKERHNTSAPQLITVSVFMLEWAVCSFIEMGVADPGRKILWRNITQIGVFYTPAAALMFSITYTGILFKYRKQLSVLIYSVQTLSILFIFTDQWHHLARESVTIVRSGIYETLVVNTTIINKVLISFNYLYLILSLGILIVFAFFTTKAMRKQVFCVILGMSISVLYSLIKVSSAERFGLLLPISGVFALTDLCMLFGILRYDLLMIAPIARNEVFNIVGEGIIIASVNGAIIDANRPALQVFAHDKNGRGNVFHYLEQDIKESFPDWHSALVYSKAAQFDLSRDCDGLTRYYNCDTYTVKNKSNKIIGSISVIKDVTEQKRQKELLQFRAERDGLTGIINRPTFIERVEEILAGCPGDVCLLFFDIDHFKQVNDNYGHICGDYVLKEMCTYVSSRLGAEDVFGRMGGEEFAIFLKDKPVEQVIQFAESLRAGIEGHPFRFEDGLIGITVSIGAASGRNMRFDELYRLADLNLYKAKECGRNCVRL